MIAESRMWRLASLAMVVLVLVVSAGCIGHEYVVNRDIVVLKLSPDGSLTWTKVIDNGFDDMAEDLVELPGGGFALAGSIADSRRAWPRPVQFQLSPDGTIVSQRFVTDGFGVARAVALADDGGTAVLTGNGTVVRFDPAGRTLWTQVTGIPEAQALVRTADGGFLAGGLSEYQVLGNGTAGPGTVPQPPSLAMKTDAGGPVLAQAAGPVMTLTTLPRTRPGGAPQRKVMVARLAPDGASAWEGLYDDGGLTSLQSCAEGPDRTGFLVAGYSYNSSGSVISHPLLALRLEPDGAPSSVTQIDTAWDSILTRADGTGFRVLYRNPSQAESGSYGGGVVDAILDRDGRVLERRSIDASIAVTWTADGGYFSVGVPVGGNGLVDGATVCDAGGCMYHARTFDRQGTLVADRALLVPQFDQAEKVVQTADGGFAVLAFINHH